VIAAKANLFAMQAIRCWNDCGGGRQSTICHPGPTAAQRGFAPVKFLIDKTASRFTVQAFATGLLSSFGHNPTIEIRDYDGELQFVPETYDQAFVRVIVKTTGLDVLDEMKRDDRKRLEQTMYEQVLDVKQFPTAVYESNEIKVEKSGNGQIVAHLKGQLLFHGVAQNRSLDARVLEMGSMLRISGDFTLQQSSFGVKPFAFAGGALRLKDELKFKFELVVREQEEQDASEQPR
jgi:polyisoprenoid-binding protein YceI